MSVCYGVLSEYTDIYFLSVAKINYIIYIKIFTKVCTIKEYIIYTKNVTITLCNVMCIFQKWIVEEYKQLQNIILRR